MKAEIVTYETELMTNGKRSTLSKKMFGFTDRTKKSKYVYRRRGVLQSIAHLKISKKTFVVSSKDAKQIKKIVKEHGANVKSWTIAINEKKLIKTYG